MQFAQVHLVYIIIGLCVYAGCEIDVVEYNYRVQKMKTEDVHVSL